MNPSCGPDAEKHIMIMILKENSEVAFRHKCSMYWSNQSIWIAYLCKISQCSIFQCLIGAYNLLWLLIANMWHAIQIRRHVGNLLKLEIHIKNFFLIDAMTWNSYNRALLSTTEDKDPRWPLLSTWYWKCTIAISIYST